MKRLVEHIITDPIIDVVFLYPLVKDTRYHMILQRQAVLYMKYGSLGENTPPYWEYSKKIRDFVVERAKSIYRDVDKYLDKNLIEKKSRLAWRSIITYYAYLTIINESGLKLEGIFPFHRVDLSIIAKFIDKLLERKTESHRGATAKIFAETLESFEINEIEKQELMAFFWWINLIMESDVFEGILKFNYLAYAKQKMIDQFVDDIEKFLSKFRYHRIDYEYSRYELLRALLSRCGELRSQYINKLQNAIVFIKVFRRKISNPVEWKWFITSDMLTYSASIYLTEIQKLINSESINLRISELIAPRKGAYAGEASILSSLVLLSPVFMQYHIEMKDKLAITPADIIITVLRLINKHNSLDDFTIHINDFANELLDFWREVGFISRVNSYLGQKTNEELTSEAVHSMNTFVLSLALLINSHISGIYISTARKPLLRLPPRMIGFDSLFIRPKSFLPIVKKI